jgi:predicted AAA+ superfamily ATPase
VINLEDIVRSEREVVLYRAVFQDAQVGKFLQFSKELARAIPDAHRVLELYYDFTAAFLPHAAQRAVPGRNVWQDYLLELLLEDDNLFTRQAERKGYQEISAPLRQIAAHDLSCLQKIASGSWDELQHEMRVKIGGRLEINQLPGWEGIYRDDDARDNCCRKGSESSHTQSCSGRDGACSLEQVKEAFAGFGHWDDDAAMDMLTNYYRTHGVGLMGKYHSFRWVKGNKGEGTLAGVQHPDPVSFVSLYEYEDEQKKVIENTEQFLAGYPANNVLLYGERGTGKSSTVKALVNKYRTRGLRLIEVQKQDLGDFPLIINELVARPQKFILFIDDLSFSADEGEFRELKAILEGSLERRPPNVLVYATTNRRHLIQESFADRQEDDQGKGLEHDDVRFMDTLQEKFSLADRFGITVTFTAPDQERYLKIVEKLAAERGLDIERQELRQSALKWELRFNARSARTAKQFIDYLEGKLGLKKQH